MTRVFVSYSRSDRSFAFRLAVDLTRAGLSVWYDRWEILPGDSIVEKIDSALRAHDCLLVVLSPEALKSQWVRRELNSSLMSHLAGKQVKVTPVMRSECEMPALISDLRYADFTDSYESGFAELLASFGLTPRHNNAVPAKIVRATRTKVVIGSSILADADEVPVSPYSRISQRHVISDFEFLE